ncbi:hypothetical protein PVAND_005191 [Polypedilum vanderplanki]|uniref:CID domain-containing protein n=1 Tax=Polypedilum vanderplanki TaxID=319348 RepID=A0A9J6C0B2_POLVA|nr:hypothetical protein PVAND_005191 [Polypedilum vanderplanki]
MEFDSEKFERRLLNLKDTQDSITSMSKWCLSKRAAHKQIVKSWLKVLKEVKIEQRLTLFYLANDVIQHSKRKGYEFVDSWATALQRASTLVRDDTRVKDKISRIFNIWQQREIYAEDFISDLNGLLSINHAKKPTSSASTSITASPTSSSPHRMSQSRCDDYEDEFQLSSVVSSIRNCVALESATDKTLKDAIKVNVPDVEKFRNSLKDRAHVEDLEKDVENAGKKYELFIENLTAEIKARKILLTALDQAEKFYRNQRRDVKKVVYAYKNFGDRIKSIHTEVNNKVTTLPSPMPSPDINAPSPEPDNDFDLPNEMNFYNTNMNGTFGSFMNNDGQLPFDLNEFYRESPPPVEHNQSIQVIQSKEQQQQPTAPLNDFYGSLISPKMESYNPTAPYIDPYRQQPPPPLPVTVPAAVAPVNYSYNSLIPPPPPPQSMNSSNDDYNWNEWNEYNLNETPVSPPHFERKGHDEGIIEYVDETLRDVDTSLNDIDHRQLFGADIESKDVDHRNLISLTGSPGESQTNGNEYLPSLLEPSPSTANFMSHGEQHNSHAGISNFPLQNRNPRPALLPTPNIPPQRYVHSISMSSDTSQGHDEIETSEVDMDLSDDDGMENKHLSGDQFYNINQHSRFPHQIPLNRPPPPLPLTPENDLSHQKPWLMNKNNQDMQQMDDELSDGSNQSLLTPPNFVGHQNNRNFSRGSFRGQNRNMNPNKSNNAPYNNFKGNRGRGAGRGSFRGNFRGGQW